MVKAKTGITLLKRVGFVLIALPEPITTPVGVACVLASSYMSRLREATIDKCLHETLALYKTRTRKAHAEIDNKSHASRKVKPYMRVSSIAQVGIQPSITPVHVNTATISLQKQPHAGNAGVIRRGIDKESISRRYPLVIDTTIKARFVPDESGVNDIKPIFHRVDRQFLYRRYAQAEIVEEQAKGPGNWPSNNASQDARFHTVDMSSLSRRYRGDPSPHTLPASPVECRDSVKAAKSSKYRRELGEIVRAKAEIRQGSESSSTIQRHRIDFERLSKRYGQTFTAV